MTTLSRSKETCIKCNTQDVFYSIMSTNQMGACDLDFRPPENFRSTMEQWLHRCPNCNYVNNNINVDNGVSDEFIFDSEYFKEVSADFELDETVKNFVLYALEMLDKNEHYSAGTSYLRAAWVCDDLDENDKATLYRNKALDCFEDVKLDSLIDGNRIKLALIKIDILRRVRLFDVAIIECRKLKEDASEKDLATIKYQEKLCYLYDDAMHTFDDIIY